MLTFLMVNVKMNDNGYITIHKRYLKAYLAVKEKALIIHMGMEIGKTF